MASYPPPPSGYPPPPPGWDPRAERRYYRDQARAQRAAFRMQQQQMRYQMRSMRRGSVLGPILLITIGIVFLLIQTGRLDHSRFWGWYGHWWPLLLVCAGILVLAEWTFDQYLQRDPQRPQYRRSVGAGVVILLLVFVVTGIAASVNHQFPWGNPRMMGFHFDQDTMDQMFGDKHESDQNLDMAFAAGSSLTVVNPRGDVTINGTSDDGRIHIAVHKQVYARTDSDADSKAQQLSPDVNTSGSDVIDQTAFARWRAWGLGDLRSGSRRDHRQYRSRRRPCRVNQGACTGDGESWGHRIVGDHRAGNRAHE